MSETATNTALTPLSGRRVAITGGTTGIGRAIAVLLASEGARVFVCGRHADSLEDALVRIRAVGDGDGIALDLAEDDGVARFLAAAKQAMGGFDVVVANAAVGAQGLVDMSEADLRTAIATNFTGYLLTAQGGAKAMLAENGSAGGDIVLVGSMSAYVLGPSSTVYAGIKYGIQGFSVALRRELGPKGIRVALIEPGLTSTDMQTNPPEDQVRMIAAEESLTAEDIAAGVHYLLTQPRRAVIQRLTIAPRMRDVE